MYDQSYTAKTYAAILLEECNHLYGGHPGDDTTVCVVKVRDRSQVNLMIGPPSDRKDTNKYMSLFFSKEGKHIVCGGTTSTLASEFLHKPMVADLNYLDPEIPPIAKIEGVDSGHRRRDHHQQGTGVRQKFPGGQFLLQPVGI